MYIITGGAGSSHVALLNRKPIVDLNANIRHLFTFLENSILLSKHYFSKEKVNSLLNGFKNILLEKFEEGKFPRKLFFVVNEKKN